MLNAPKVSLQEETGERPFAVLSELPGIVDEETRKELANVQLFDMYLPNFSMRISQGKYRHDVMMVNSGAVGLEYMGSCLFLEGNVKTHLRIGDDTFEAPTGTQSFKYDPQNEFCHWLPANVPFRIAHFSVLPEHFLELLPENELWADKLKGRVLRKERILGERTPAISVAQAQALQLILNCPLTGKLGQTMIETAIVQIMLLNLHSLFQAEQDKAFSINSKDRNTAKAVKEYIESNYLLDHSLGDLTKHFATNSNKLMSIFRKAFGKSIFEYIGELRMKYAHELLLKEDRSVNEVSRIIGYKNANHFSAAFKKRFGVSPAMVGK
jgi:AraC-like DNA-binding protein